MKLVEMVASGYAHGWGPRGGCTDHLSMPSLTPWGTSDELGGTATQRCAVIQFDAFSAGHVFHLTPNYVGRNCEVVIRV